jgi:uncharacterized phosphosugar-binding protein
MAKLTRRNVLKTGAALAAGTIAAGTSARRVDAADRAGTKYNWGHTMDFGEQYFVRITEILQSIRRTEMGLIGDISSRMAETVKKGGNVYYNAFEGHMGGFECIEGNKGNPGIIKSTAKNINFAAMKPGELLVTDKVNKNVRTARENGVYVVGVPVNYTDNEWTPRGYVNPNANNWLLGDVSNVILQSYVPYTQGIVDCPEVPEMKICPSSSNAMCTLFWMFQCELANKLKNPKALPVDKSAIFLDTVLDRFREAYRTQKDLLFDTAPTVAKRIGGGAHFHVTSDHGGVQGEATGVAMGPMMTNSLRKQTMQPNPAAMVKGDVHLLASINPDSKKIVDETKRSKDLGMFVISIAPGNSIKIRENSDVFIDNLGPEGEGFMDITGFPEKIAVVNGIMNNMLMWTFTAQFIDEMVRRGWVPWFWFGFYQIGGSAYDTAVKPFFLKQGF